MKKIVLSFINKVSSRYFESLVSSAYKEKNGKSHKKIINNAYKWYGIKKVSYLKRRISSLFVLLVIKAQYRLFDKGMYMDLGSANIGFDELKIYCSTKDFNSSYVYLSGFSSNKNFFDTYKKYATPSSIAIDIGANLGIHSLVLSKCIGESGRVYSYEPVKHIYTKLCDNIKLNGISNIVTKELGVSEAPGEVCFNLNETDFNIGMAHIDENGEGKIKVVTIDDEFKGTKSPISVIKIDVEGLELSIIKGAQKILSEFKPVIILEFNPDYYTFEELYENIPFEAQYFIHASSYLNNNQEITNKCFDNRVDILIIPK